MLFLIYHFNIIVSNLLLVIILFYFVKISSFFINLITTYLFITFLCSIISCFNYVYYYHSIIIIHIIIIDHHIHRLNYHYYYHPSLKIYSSMIPSAYALSSLIIYRLLSQNIIDDMLIIFLNV
jgi:hypothetical protein